MEEVQFEKTCQNCRYYSQHYSKQGIRYIFAFCGHCIKRGSKSRKNNRSLIVCDLWEDVAIKKEERKKSIKKTLESMSERLDEIAMILQDDAE